MQTLIGGSRTLYAAIEARYADGAAERFVIAYTCEQSLRELLVAPSIVASGCPTREHAEEICRGETLGRNRSQRQVGYVFGLNALPRFALRYGLSSAGMRSFCSMFFIFVGACFRRSRFMSARPLKKFTDRVRNTEPYADSLTERFTLNLCCSPAYRSIRVAPANLNDPIPRRGLNWRSSQRSFSGFFCISS